MVGMALQIGKQKRFTFIESEDLDVIFSHFHAVDLQEHMFIKHLAEREDNRLDHEDYEKFLEDIYIQTDYYLGKFLHYLDEGWTIMIFSDHAQVASKYGQQYLVILLVST